ncbi:hypothetical protein [Rhodopila sp.]|uniref:hypothetical protein n=1 Tax=Rhodopila sp. TaxID=2480087 RepID=UPI003D12D7CB
MGVETNPPLFSPFYQSLGTAIATWQHVESALCSVFISVSTCRIEEVASAIFYNFRDFSDKLDLVHRAARLSLSADHPGLIEWIGVTKKPGLRRRLQLASERRNSLAHFRLVVQLPGASESGTFGPKLNLAILRISEDGFVVMGDPAGVDPHPAGVSLLLQPNSDDPNLRFNPKPAETKTSMTIRDITQVQRLFQSLTQEVKALAEKVRMPQTSEER